MQRAGGRRSFSSSPDEGRSSTSRTTGGEEEHIFLEPQEQGHRARRYARVGDGAGNARDDGSARRAGRVVSLKGKSSSSWFVGGARSADLRAGRVAAVNSAATRRGSRKSSSSPAHICAFLERLFFSSRSSRFRSRRRCRACSLCMVGTVVRGSDI